MTQSELAEKSGIPQHKLSRYEGELTNIPDECIDPIAEVLRYPKTFFYQPDFVYPFGSPCVYHRKRQSLSVTSGKFVHALLNIVRMGVSRLLQAVEIEHENRFQRVDLDECGGPESVAAKVRRSWGLSDGPIRNLIGVVERAGGIVVSCDFGTKKIDAVSQWPAELPMPPVFLINSAIPTDRARFSLAHEIGHVIMHGTGICGVDLEDEADRFAAEFLMPANEIRASLSPLSLPRLADLKQHWGASMASLLYRAKQLGTVTEWQSRRLWEQLSASGYRTNEPVALPPEYPSVLKDIIAAHSDHLHYTEKEFEQTVHLQWDEFKSIFPVPSQSAPVPRFKIVG